MWHSKPITDITDLVAGRIYTHEHVQEATARLISPAAGWAAIQHDRGFGHG